MTNRLCLVLSASVCLLARTLAFAVPPGCVQPCRPGPTGIEIRPGTTLQDPDPVCPGISVSLVVYARDFDSCGDPNNCPDGIIYAWEAAGGTPASGSGSSFSPHLVNLGLTR
jgi:hypothetical protein